LRSGTEVTHTDGVTILQPRRFLVLEEPFGRARPEMAALIDYVVGIDLPLEIALARRLRALVRSRQPQAPSDQVLTELDQYLQQYLAVLHDGYQAIQAKALHSSDLVVDGRRSMDELAHAAATAVQQRFPTAFERRASTGAPS
jgi:uridine kinase